jgi:hypothetical protein
MGLHTGAATLAYRDYEVCLIVVSLSKNAASGESIVTSRSKSGSLDLNSSSLLSRKRCCGLQEFF